MARIFEYSVPFKQDTRYAYAVGRIRALETRLLTRQDFERMVDARDAGEALKVLSETGYSPAVSRFGDPYQFEELLRFQLKETLDLVASLFEREELTGLFKLRYDYHNLKVLLKAKYSHRYLGFALVNLGTIDPDRLQRAVLGEFDGIPERLLRTIESAESIYGETGEPQTIDIEVDKQLFSYLLTDEVVAKIPFLFGWVEREIDLANIKSFLRIGWMGGDIDILRLSLMDGGSLSPGLFLSLEEQPLEVLPQALSRTRYAHLVEEGVAQIKGADSFSRLERLCDEFVISYLKRSGYVVFGPEPIVSYLLLKEYELKKIRTIMVGKLNDLAREWIRERLPDVHV